MFVKGRVLLVVMLVARVCICLYCWIWFVLFAVVLMLLFVFALPILFCFVVMLRSYRLSEVSLVLFELCCI